MKENELDHLLTTVRVPERTDDYWNEFPKEVTAALRRQVPVRVGLERGLWPNLKLLSGWGLGLAKIALENATLDIAKRIVPQLLR